MFNFLNIILFIPWFLFKHSIIWWLGQYLDLFYRLWIFQSVTMDKLYLCYFHALQMLLSFKKWGESWFMIIFLFHPLFKEYFWFLFILHFLPSLSQWRFNCSLSSLLSSLYAWIYCWLCYQYLTIANDQICFRIKTNPQEHLQEKLHTVQATRTRQMYAK